MGSRASVYIDLKSRAPHTGQVSEPGKVSITLGNVTVNDIQRVSAIAGRSPNQRKPTSHDSWILALSPPISASGRAGCKTLRFRSINAFGRCNPFLYALATYIAVKAIVAPV